MTRARIGVLLGDPSGIGPEVVTRLLARPQIHEVADVVVLTDPSVLAAGERTAGVRLTCEPGAPAADRGVAGRPTMVALDLIAPDDIVVGAPTAASGRCVLDSIRAAVDRIKLGQLDGLVYGPLNKKAMRLAGLELEDEMRFMKMLLGHDEIISEINITGRLWTSRVTSHIPLREVADHITVEGVCGAIAILDAALRDAGVERPRLAVAGLNPHAGDGGSFGREEIDVIAPAIRAMNDRGVAALGPLSPDTMFLTARRDNLDGVVTMYHDQGQIAMKLMGFDHGVTLHAGQPVPITTCASGSAFDIAGKGIANVEGMQAAFDVCARMAANARARRGAG
jgi:4-hydroxythreonine-4-phosphate dehydrogenase